MALGAHLSSKGKRYGNFALFLTLILGMDASTLQWVKGACSVIPFKMRPYLRK